MDETLALQALGVTDPDVVKTVCSSNAQEAVHDTIGDWEEHIGRWFEPSDTGASELPAVP